MNMISRGIWYKVKKIGGVPYTCKKSVRNESASPLCFLVPILNEIGAVDKNANGVDEVAVCGCCVIPEEAAEAEAPLDVVDPAFSPSPCPLPAIDVKPGEDGGVITWVLFAFPAAVPFGVEVKASLLGEARFKRKALPPGERVCVEAPTVRVDMDDFP